MTKPRLVCLCGSTRFHKEVVLISRGDEKLELDAAEAAL